MKKLLFFLLFPVLALAQGQSGGTASRFNPVPSNPSGACVNASVWYNTTTNQGYICLGGVATQIGSGSGTIGGSGTANFIPLWGATTTLANSHWDDGITTVGTLTASEPVQIQASGNGVSLLQGSSCTPTSSYDILCPTSTGLQLSNNNNAFSTVKTGLNTPPDPALLGGLVGTAGTTGTSGVSSGISTNLAPGASNYFVVIPEEIYLGNLTAYITTANTSAMTRISNLCCLGSAGQDFPPFVNVPFGAAANSVTSFPNATPFYISSGAHHLFHISQFGTTGGTVNAVAARIVGSQKGVLATNQINTQVAGSGTTFTGPSQKNGLNSNATESLVEMPMPFAITADSMCIYVLATGQPSGGALNFTLDNNGVATAIVPSVPTSSNTNVPYCDQLHTASYNAGDRMSFKEVNASASTGGTITGISVGYAPTVAANVAMMLWGLGTQTITNASQFWMAFTGTASAATHGTADFGMPGGGTLDQLYCYVTTAPVTTNETITVYLNGVATAVTISLTTGQLVPNNVTDLTHSFAFNRGDLITLNTTQGGTGTAPALSGCAARITWSN